MTRSAVEILGLSDKEAEMAEEAVFAFKKDIASRLASSARYIEAESDRSRGYHVYKLPHIRDRSEIIEQMRRGLREKIGDTKADGVVDLMLNDTSFREQLAGCGLYDAIVEIAMPSDDRKENGFLKFRYFDPTTGKRVLSSSVSVHAMKDEFGDVFDLSSMGQE